MPSAGLHIFSQPFPSYNTDSPAQQLKRQRRLKEHLLTTLHSPTSPPMDKRVLKQSEAFNGTAAGNKSVKDASVQLITPPLADNNLRPGQVDFDHQSGDEVLISIRPPPSPASTTTACEDQSLSRDVSPLATTSASEPAQDTINHSITTQEAAEALLTLSRSTFVNDSPGKIEVQESKPVVTPADKQGAKPTKKAAPPAAKTKKRKHEDEDAGKEAPKPGPKKSKPQGKTQRRRSFDEHNQKASLSETFARHVKGMLNARSAEKDNYAAFRDAILPNNSPKLDLAEPILKHAVAPASRLEDIGDATGLHPREVEVCKQLAITADTYRCQKARFFLGLAIFTEYNYQALMTGKPDSKIWNVGKSQCQLFNNMDVNKSSDLYQAFETWGWVEPMGKKDPVRKQWAVSPNYLARFPQDHRRRLMQEVAEYEIEGDLTRIAKV